MDILKKLDRIFLTLLEMVVENKIKLVNCVPEVPS